MTIGVRQFKTGLNKVMGRNLIAWVSKTCGHRQADYGRIKPWSETVNNPDSDSFRPQNQGSRTQNPKQTSPQPPLERGWADKADSRPPLRGPGQYCSAPGLLWDENRGGKGLSQVRTSSVSAFRRRFGQGTALGRGRRAQHRTPRPTGVMQSRAASTFLLFGSSQSLQVSLHLLLGGPTKQVILQHLVRPLGWLPTGPQGNQEAGNQRHVGLDRHAIGAGRQQVAAAQDAFEPAEEKFHRPAVLVRQGHQVRIQVQLVGNQPKLLDTSVEPDPFHHDQPDRLTKIVLVMGRPELRNHDIADDPGRLGLCRERPLLLHCKNGTVLDPGHKRRSRVEDLSKQLEAGVAAVDDVKPPRLEHGGQLIGLRARRWSYRGIGWDGGEDVEMKVELDAAVLLVLPQ